MPGGRPRTPTRVLQMRGTFRADRHGDPTTEIQLEPVTGLPNPPHFFDAIAAFEWNRIGHELIEKGLLTQGDMGAFTMYCLNCARVAACEVILKARGMTYITDQGYEMARPEVSIARQCGAEVRKFAQEFGLTPSARSRVRVTTPAAEKPKSGWDEVAGG